MSGTVAVVLAPPLDSYLPLWRSRSSERIENCACGTAIVQRTGEDAPLVVMAHNASASHRAWRERGT